MQVCALIIIILAMAAWVLHLARVDLKALDIIKRARETTAFFDIFKRVNANEFDIFLEH